MQAKIVMAWLSPSLTVISCRLGIKSRNLRCRRCFDDVTVIADAKVAFVDDEKRGPTESAPSRVTFTVKRERAATKMNHSQGPLPRMVMSDVSKANLPLIYY